MREVISECPLAFMAFDIESTPEIAEIGEELSQAIGKKVIVLDEGKLTGEALVYPGDYAPVTALTEHVFLLIENGCHEDVRLAIDYYTRAANASNFYFETTD